VMQFSLSYPEEDRECNGLLFPHRMRRSHQHVQPTAPEKVSLPTCSDITLHISLPFDTVASRFRCRSCERGYIFQGLQNSSLPPRSALWVTCDDTQGLIEFLLSRQSFSAAFRSHSGLPTVRELKNSVNPSTVIVINRR
jgi:hypothetical protein